MTTRLFDKKIDEQIITQMTGHRSVDGVRSYKRTESRQIKDACAVIDGTCGCIENVSSEKYRDSRKLTFNFHNCNVTTTNNP